MTTHDEYSGPRSESYGWSLKPNPELSEWTLHVLGPSGIAYTPPKGDEPNWFHRLMQEVILGFRWRRTDSKIKRKQRERP